MLAPTAIPARRNQRNLRDENREKHDKELPRTRRIAVNFLEHLLSLSLTSSKVVCDAVGNAPSNLLDPRLTVHHLFLIGI